MNANIKHILIATTPGDLHATMVTTALRALGHKSTIWIPGDMPEAAVASWSIGNDIGSTVSAVQIDGNIDFSIIDTFWFRRSAKISISREMHESDRKMATNETVEHVRGLMQSVSTKLYSVNNYKFAMAAEIKHHQLHTAKKIGFILPKTLISNDPKQIRLFIAANASTGTIYKPFKTAVWAAEKSTAYSYTAEVQEADLPSDTTLQMTPGIFQEKLEKKYEVRVTCMGKEIVAVKLHSQAVAGAMIDWRPVQNFELKPEQIKLPPLIEEKCVLLLQKLGLEFGCIDIVVRPNGDHVFLEINQMGQFLWIEQINPEIQMLDKFVQFLLRAGCEVNKHDQNGFGISYHEFYEEASKYMEAIIASHKNIEQSSFVYSE